MVPRWQESEKKMSAGYLTVTKNVIPYLHLWCSLYRDPSGGGGVLWISSDGNDRMGAKIKTPKKLLDQELTPKKSHAEFPSLKKFGCTLFAEQRGWDTQAIPRIFRLF